MPFSSGVYTLPTNSFAQPVASTTISSTDATSTWADFVTAFSTCVLKDGTQTMTGNLPMSGFKLTGLGAGSANGNSLRYEQIQGVNLTDAPLVSQIQNASATTLSSVAGTNTITGTATPTPAAYASGQSFDFIPAVTNTAATTINISSLGAKNVFWCGAACSGGELVAGVPVRIKYDGTQFNIIGPTIGTRITNSLSGDVAINNASNYFDGPSVAQGTVGTWFVSGTVTWLDTAATLTATIKLWDGTNVIASCASTNSFANTGVAASLSGYITSPAANLRISVKTGSTTGAIKFNASGNSKDSTISAVRVG